MVWPEGPHGPEDPLPSSPPPPGTSWDLDHRANGHQQTKDWWPPKVPGLAPGRLTSQCLANQLLPVAQEPDPRLGTPAVQLWLKLREGREGPCQVQCCA